MNRIRESVAKEVEDLLRKRDSRYQERIQTMDLDENEREGLNYACLALRKFGDEVRRVLLGEAGRTIEEMDKERDDNLRGSFDDQK